MATLRLFAAALAVALALGTAAAAQGPAAAPGPAAAGLSPVCMDAVLNMSDCLTYVTAGSKARHPDKPCCPELAGLLGSHPVCLCQLLAGGAESYGVDVDYKRALALPGICRLTAPPVGACAVLGVPVPAGMVPSAAPVSGTSPSSSKGAPVVSGTSPSSSSTGPEVPANTTGSPNHAPGRRFSSTGLLALAVAAAAGMF